MRRNVLMTVVLIGLALVGLALGIYSGVRVLGTGTRPNTHELRDWGLVNGSRALANRAVLHHDLELSACARDHSERMAARGRLYHSTSGQLRNCDRTWRNVAENVGVGASLYQVHRAFLGSAEHRANILNRGYRAVGVGVVFANNQFWVTLLFGGR